MPVKLVLFLASWSWKYLGKWLDPESWKILTESHIVCEIGLHRVLLFVQGAPTRVKVKWYPSSLRKLHTLRLHCLKGNKSIPSLRGGCWLAEAICILHLYSDCPLTGPVTQSEPCTLRLSLFPEGLALGSMRAGAAVAVLLSHGDQEWGHQVEGCRAHLEDGWKAGLSHASGDQIEPSLKRVLF